MIQRLDFAEPFFYVDYVEGESAYLINDRSILINLAEREHKNLWIKGSPLLPLHSTIVKNVIVEHVAKALVVKNYEGCNVEDQRIVDQIKHTWKSLWEYSHLECNRDIPYYKSPRCIVGGNTAMNFCLAEAETPSAIHKEHLSDFDEIHLQVCGIGIVQKLDQDNSDTLYQEFILCPGVANDKIWNSGGEYPWHRYLSITRGIFIVIEIQRGGEA